MEEIEASRRTMEENAQANEELCKTNEQLRRNMHRHERHNIWARSPDMFSRDDPKPFSQKIIEEPIPPHFIMPKITSFSSMQDPGSHLKAFRAQIIISGRTSSNERCSWARSQEPFFNGSAGSPTTISPFFHSSLGYLKSNSQLIKSTPHGCQISLMSNKGKQNCLRIT